jgi:hypothetical protein
MNRTRLALCVAVSTVAFGALATACGSSSNNSNQNGSDSGGLDSTTGGMDSPVPEDGGMPPGQDSSTGQDSTTPSDASDGGTSTSDASDTGTVDTGADGGPVDAAKDASDTGADAPVDAPSDAPPLPGPGCRAADGGPTQCASGQHCCVTTVSQATACAASCDNDAGTYQVDCTGSTGQCANIPVAPLCCAKLVTNGSDAAATCGPVVFTSTCAPACGTENPPGTTCDTLPHVLRLCSAAADCANDDAGARTHCCSFGANPVSWCVDSLAAGAPGATCK